MLAIFVVAAYSTLRIHGTRAKDLRSFCAELSYLFLNHGVLCAPQSMQTYVEAMFNNKSCLSGYLFVTHCRHLLTANPRTATPGRGLII